MYVHHPLSIICSLRSLSFVSRGAQDRKFYGRSVTSTRFFWLQGIFGLGHESIRSILCTRDSNSLMDGNEIIYLLGNESIGEQVAR